MNELLSDRIQSFIDWLESNTDFSMWDQSIKTEVHRQLIIAMIPVQAKPKHEWQFYMNGTFCRRCGAHIGSNSECK